MLLHQVVGKDGPEGREVLGLTDLDAVGTGLVGGIMTVALPLHGTSGNNDRRHVAPQQATLTNDVDGIEVFLGRQPMIDRRHWLINHAANALAAKEGTELGKELADMSRGRLGRHDQSAIRQALMRIERIANPIGWQQGIQATVKIA